MRPLWKDILAAVWLGLIIPGIVLNGFVWKQRHAEAHKAGVEQVRIPESPGPCIPVNSRDGICSMDLETYLTGVLLAEMPAAFHDEALKAQAVAARTYAWKMHSTGRKHVDGGVCTDPACCQAYIAEDDYLSQGGTVENLEKVRSAVRETAPIVLLYDGELIEATYFSSSGGSTESALEVWGADYPYLQPVSSPEVVVAETVTYTPGEFQVLLGRDLSEEPEKWFGTVTYTTGGGVDTAEICGESYSGVQLRSLLGLRSTVFQLQVENGCIQIRTKGYGHRVGMSQHGANTMAEQGSTWQQILQHYYPGTNLAPIY